MDYDKLSEAFNEYRLKSVAAFNDCIDLIEKLEEENKSLRSRIDSSVGCDSERDVITNAIFVGKDKEARAYKSSFTSVSNDDSDTGYDKNEEKVYMTTHEFFSSTVKNRRW